MEITRLQNIALALAMILFFAQTSWGQQQMSEDTLMVLLNDLYNQRGQTRSIKKLPSNTIYLFMTNRTCGHCYTDLEHYYRKKYPNYLVTIIVFMPDNPLVIKYKLATVNRFYKNSKTVYFLCQDEEDAEKNTIITYFSGLPSPYFFLVDNDKKILYFDVFSTSKLIFH